LLTFTLLESSAQQESLGIFEQQTDVGKPKLSGESRYDADAQLYHLKGAGYNIWFERDEFHFLHRKIQGDFILTANFKLLGEGTDPHRKVGWMLRESLQDDAAHVSAVLHGDGLTVLQWRALRGAYMRDPEDEIFFPKQSAEIMQLERSGNTIFMRVANPGEPLQLVGSYESSDLPDEIYAGPFICSHNPDVVEEAEIWNVRLDKPVPEDYNAYQQGYLSSRLEIMDVFSAKRKVIYTSPQGFEAPNWMPDGERLLFNQSGSLFTINIDGANVQKLNTGSVNRNNNDHGISFDGKMLAISSSSENTSSRVYVLPISGGEPELVTEKSPSYWHGWSANNREVYYVAQRSEGGPFNIYKKGIRGGPEVQLTFSENAHADGPESTPDGKYIYYNSTASGTMQIWRMKPDGSGQEQVTFDQYNDWFPHISPDGKWIAFLSFDTDVAPQDHPFYKRVMLRLMPASGGAPKVIAYLYGGQGTINVPSWSPDSRHIAFVSNPGLMQLQLP
jgi:Tol biopolymer transport system component